MIHNFQQKSYSFSHRGQRHRNEDFYIADDQNGIYILTDGMGGYEGGEVAGRIAANSCHEYLKSHLEGPVYPDDLIDSIRARLKSVTQRFPEYASMGTTLCCVYIREEYINVLHIGDSKIIIVSNTIYETTDHTYAQHLIDHDFIRADEYRRHPMRHILTRCLTANNQEKYKADYQKIPLQNGRNTFFICSDGVLETFSSAEAIQMIKAEQDIQKLIQTVELNTLKYSQDNSTAIIVRYNYSIN